MHLSSATKHEKKQMQSTHICQTKGDKATVDKCRKTEENCLALSTEQLLAQSGLNQLPTQDQYLELPQAIADANARGFLHGRYEI